MKTKLLILSFFLLTAWSCQESNFQEEQPETLELTSEKGFKIANTVDDLKERIKSDVISDGENLDDFSISKVTYSYHGEHTFALVDFRKLDGTTGNILITNSSLMAKSLSNGRTNCSSCDCYRIKCTGTCGCQVGYQPPQIEGGPPTFFCTCTDCTMDVRQYDCP